MDRRPVGTGSAAPNRSSPEDRDLWLEQALLSEVIFLHPDHLTSEELVLKMEDGPSDTGRIAILDSRQSTAGVSTGPVLGIENASAGTVGSGSGLGDVFEVRL